MADELVSRRRLLQLGGAASAVALAGCSDDILSDDGTGTATTSPDVVPASPNLIASVDVNAALQDGTLRQQINDALAEFDPAMGEQVTVEDALDEIESNLGLDPRRVSELLVYADVEAEKAALVVDAGWTGEEIQSAMAAEVEVETETYEGQTIYEAPDTAVGVLPDDRYVMSTREGAREVLDVAVGNAPAADGNVADGFTSTPAGYARFAFEPPADFTAPPGGEFDMSVLEDLSYGYGALYSDGTTTGGELVLEATSTESAEEIEETADGLLAFASLQLGADEEVPEDVMTVLDATSVSQSGTSVTIENDDGRGLLPLVPLVSLGGFALGFGTQASASVSATDDGAPQAAFEFDYDEDANELAIMCVSGDSIPATELYVRGTSSRTGSWADIGGMDTVRAGEMIVIDAEPDAIVQLIWDSGQSRSVIGKWQGPGV